MKEFISPPLLILVLSDVGYSCAMAGDGVTEKICRSRCVVACIKWHECEDALFSACEAVTVCHWMRTGGLQVAYCRNFQSDSYQCQEATLK